MRKWTDGKLDDLPDRAAVEEIEAYINRYSTIKTVSRCVSIAAAVLNMSAAVILWKPEYFIW